MAGSPPPVPESNKEVTSGQVVSLYAAQKKIYPRSIQGQFTNWRWIFVWLTQIIFYGLPWLEWGQRQAVLFDLEARRFYIFGLLLYPQDFIYLTGILVVCALSLFLFTAVAGRLWCGYACPQTVYSEIFLWIEYKVEGDRSARLRLDGSSVDSAKIGKKSLKQLIWIAFSVWTGFTFVAYFTPARELIGAFVHAQMSAWELFWVFFYGFMTYGNAGYMREQICKYMCPYARFQSAMFDKDTLVVVYDAVRGDPRGPRNKAIDHKAEGLGACIDCALCVQVCPTGIDIRKGLQYECIGCGACVDACDNVMDKVGYPRGLVRYATQSSMETASGSAIQGAWAQVRASLMRPRILVYSSLLAVVTISMFVSLALRSPFKVDVVRDRTTLSRIVEGGKIENVYRMQIMNATEQIQHYKVQATGIVGLTIEDNHPVAIESAQSRWVPLTVRVPNGVAQPGSVPIVFEIQAVAGGQVIATVSEKSVFLIPR